MNALATLATTPSKQKSMIELTKTASAINAKRPAKRVRRRHPANPIAFIRNVYFFMIFNF